MIPNQDFLTLCICLLMSLFLGSYFIDQEQIQVSQRFDTFYQSHRYYDPKLARFINSDTLIPNSTTAKAFNRYTYVYNNPLKYTDPSGHMPVGGGWIDRIIDAFFGDRSRPPPSSYRGSVGGNSYGSFMSQRALDSQQLDDNVIKLAAGAAVAARETEIKTVAASIGGLLDGTQTVNPYTYMSPEYYTLGGVPTRSETLFDLVELDLKKDPLMKVPYAAGFSAAPALILIPRFQSPPQPRGLPAPPQVRPIRTVRPRPGRRHQRDLQPGEVPVIVGGSSPPDLNFSDPHRYSDYEPGSTVHEVFHLNEGHKSSVILSPSRIENKVLIREYTIIFKFDNSDELFVDAHICGRSKDGFVNSGYESLKNGVLVYQRLKGTDPNFYTVEGIVGDDGSFIQTSVEEMLSHAVRQ